jgi:excisionase family DNA binding protein
MAKEVMTVEEVAEYLRVTPSSIYEWAKAGKMPAAKVGRLWRFHREEIDAWVRRGGLQNSPQASETEPGQS